MTHTENQQRRPIAARPTWAEIDLDALGHNYRSIKKLIGANVSLMAVVKADAYGHGAVECSRRLEREGIDWLGTAMPEEGFELRKAGINLPILSFGNWPGQEETMIERSITPVLYQIDRAEAFNNAARRADRLQPIHVKIDTGMGRVGLPLSEIAGFMEALKHFSNLRVEGLMTHFASADSADPAFTLEQINRFQRVVETFRECGFDPAHIDLANSPGTLAYPDSWATMVRIGGIIYGLGGDVLPRGIEVPPLKPVLSLQTSVSLIKYLPIGSAIGYGGTYVTKRDSVIATVPIGYYDGLPRSLSNVGSMLVGGKRCPIVGRVSMDWTTIDVTDVADVKVGDVVTVIGSQGHEQILAEEVAEQAGTISYEITCGINRRVTKVFVERPRVDTDETKEIE